MNPPVHIRRAFPDETDHLTNLGVRSKSVWGYAPDAMRTFEPELRVTREHIISGFVFVLCCNDTTLGYYSLSPLDEDTVELQHLFVDPMHLRSGHGTTLMQHAQLTATARNFRRLAIQSDPNATGFYKRHGFAIVREVPSSIPGRSLPWLEQELEHASLTREIHTEFSNSIEHGHIDATGSLIRNHPTLVNHRDWTPPPLHCAILWDQPSIATLLLDHGADLELRDPDRNTTPLRYAVMYCKPALIPLLLAAGANSDPIEPGGRSVRQLAEAGAAGAFAEYDDLPRPDEYQSILPLLTR